MGSKRALLSQVAVIAGAILLLACGGQEGADNLRTAPPADAAAANAVNAAADAAQANGTARSAIDAGGEAIDLPSSYPTDIPSPPDAVPTRFVSSEAAGLMAQFRAGEPANSVRGFYVRELAAEGWTLKSDETIEGLTFMSAEKNGRNLIVTIEDKGSKSHIVVVSEGG